ncbi:serine/threonine-protein kinase [Streptomyces peucetius]|uniref:Protein kinase n=1 Tax=Streptomyces peucetius TaxID=1950 RepID=A0ABY6IAI8_STRPE|nr:serine/threonine protein kinase [Streptomyces peucetius]UYQ63714.1 protein kinase [Streptomyces peucetius]
MQALEPEEPRRIGAYQLLGRLGAGGMGRVYLGRSTGGRTVAVKVVHPHFALDGEFRARFRREVEAARRVGGEWTATVLDADPDAPQPWVATGYVAGPALAEAVAQHGPLPGRSVRLLGRGLAQALTAVHTVGLVHRDVKPSNVLLTLEGPRLIDFGIVRATDGTASLTSTGASVGSPGYMAPEQILGRRVTGAADVFSLGATLAYAATGEAPFPGDSSAALLYKVVHDEPELGSLDGELRDLVAACLDKDPAARPAPAEIAARLLPDAESGDGWLPTAMVEQISRAAVALLHLESSPMTDAPAPGLSGPVAFSSPAVGVFGPPLPEAPPAPAAPGHQPSVQSPVGAAARGPSAYGGDVQGPPTQRPPGQGATGQGPVGPAAAAGRWPSDTPGVQPGPSVPSVNGVAIAAGPVRRGRQISCGLALAVACAVAAVTVGSAFLLEWWPGKGDSDKGGSGTAQPPAGGDSDAAPPSGSADRAGAVPSAAAVPSALIGTWTGDVEAPTTFSAHVLTLEITAGEQNDMVARSTDHLVLSNVAEFKCHALGKLVSATDTAVRVQESVDPQRPNPPGQCQTASVVWVFTLQEDGTLRYEPEGAAPGRQSGTLTKSAG